MDRRNGARSGFSLTELLIVVTILGLIAGIVVLGSSAMLPGSHLSQAVHTLAAEVYGARSEAIARNQTYHIEYDIDAGSYQLITPFRPGGGLAREEDERLATKREEMPRGIEITRVTVDGIDYAEGKVRVRFDPLGTVSGHSVVLTQGEYESIFTLEVLPLTGMVRFHEGEFTREIPEEGDFE
ncbi:MAG: GspH/FimT family pseudopilin [Planctomycetes bacterium]|nr:GspH/FimT family pseudopilin [Planctomycetota bacterium]